MALPAYDEFLASKRLRVMPTGFTVDEGSISFDLFPYQRDIVRWALKLGKAAIFANTGLGKTAMQLTWADLVSWRTHGKVLILAPLAVAQQTVREGEKFGIAVTLCRDASDVRDGINITNYERLHLFDCSEFVGVVLDESSILKSYTSATRNLIIESFAATPYKLACTATPAPNDHMELGNHAEFLGVMSRVEMLAMFFTHDGGETQKWRLKGHAVSDFWRWVCTWAVMLRKPSDLGYDDGDFALPPLTMCQHVVESVAPQEGYLFAVEAQTLTERRRARKASLAERVAKCVEIVHGRSSEEGSQARVHAAVPSESSREVEADAGAAGGEECAPARKVRTGRHTSRKSAPASQRMAESESRQAQEPTTEESRHRLERLQGYAGGAERRLCDMRVFGHERSELLPSGGSLPQNRESTGAALRELQPRSGEIQGQRESADVGRVLPDQEQQWVVWCGLNAEQDALAAALGDECVSIQGSTSPDDKIRLHDLWLSGEKRVLISKPEIFGYGMNWQHCARIAFVGLSDSWEAYYQAIRRCWRFGQSREVVCHVITSTAEGAIVANIERKEREANEMADAMIEHIAVHNIEALGGTEREIDEYTRLVERGTRFEVHRADCVELARELDSDSLDFIVYSPPFASLYTYSNSPRDMGNVKDHDEFYRHFGYLTSEMYRALKPGRLMAVHCMNLPTSKARDGYIGISDFRGELIRIFQDAGFIYHSEVCIWKDPVTAMQRTKALGLLYKQLKKDSAMSRQGIPDYLVVMRKPGDNPDPVTKNPDDFPVDLWQHYASPVWMDINPSDTLQKESAREEADERHIAPLQLEVIRRAVKLWTNPDDLVFSPFTGIGSEGYVSITEGRRFIGSELKLSYYQQAVKNLKRAEMTASAPTLFDMAAFE